MNLIDTLRGGWRGLVVSGAMLAAAGGACAQAGPSNDDPEPVIGQMVPVTAPVEPAVVSAPESADGPVDPALGMNEADQVEAGMAASAPGVAAIDEELVPVSSIVILLQPEHPGLPTPE